MSLSQSSAPPTTMALFSMPTACLVPGILHSIVLYVGAVASSRIGRLDQRANNGKGCARWRHRSSSGRLADGSQVDDGQLPSNYEHLTSFSDIQIGFVTDRTHSLKRTTVWRSDNLHCLHWSNDAYIYMHRRRMARADWLHIEREDSDNVSN